MSEERAPYSNGNATPQTVEAFKGRPCTLNWSDPNYTPPTSAEVAALQRILGLKAKQVGALVGATYTRKGCNSVRRWKLPEEHHDKRYLSYARWRVMLFAAGIVTKKQLLDELNNLPMEAIYRGDGS